MLLGLLSLVLHWVEDHFLAKPLKELSTEVVKVKLQDLEVQGFNYGLYQHSALNAVHSYLLDAK